MNMDMYQQEAMETAIYPRLGSNLVYPVLGLAGEAGEICNKVKKIERDSGGVLSPEKRQQIVDELGDVLWYAAAICSELDVQMSDVAAANLDKLADRASHGALKGDGDKR